MLGEHSHCFDLDESVWSRWCDSKDGDGGAAITPYCTGCSVGRSDDPVLRIPPPAALNSRQGSAEAALGMIGPEAGVRGCIVYW